MTGLSPFGVQTTVFAGSLLKKTASRKRVELVERGRKPKAKSPEGEGQYVVEPRGAKVVPRLMLV